MSSHQVQSGRNTARAAVGREFPICTLSVVQRVPSSAIAHVSASPPLIPDGRISRVRLAAAACPQRTFPTIPRLKRSLVYTPRIPGYTSSSTSSEVCTMHLALSPDGVSSVTPATYREPLRLRWVLPTIRVTSRVPSESITPPSTLLRAHAPDHIPPTFISLPPAMGLCRLSQVPAGTWSFPALSPQIFPRMLGPLPRLSEWCTCSFLPTRRRPSPMPKWVGTWRALPQNDFMRAFDFGAAGIS